MGQTRTDESERRIGSPDLRQHHVLHAFHQSPRSDFFTDLSKVTVSSSLAQRATPLIHLETRTGCRAVYDGDAKRTEKGL